jgi:hypothetical protein
MLILGQGSILKKIIECVSDSMAVVKKDDGLVTFLSYQPVKDIGVISVRGAPIYRNLLWAHGPAVDADVVDQAPEVGSGFHVAGANIQAVG